MSEEIDVDPNESDVQSAIIDIATKKIAELTNQSILLEANLLVCQQNFRFRMNASKDVSSEFDEFKDLNLEKIKHYKEENNELKFELKSLTDDFKTADSDRIALRRRKDEVNSNKKELGEVTSKLEVANQEIADLKIKIESGYKTQIRELKQALEAANGDNNTHKEKLN